MKLLLPKSYKSIYWTSSTTNRSAIWSTCVTPHNYLIIRTNFLIFSNSKIVIAEEVDSRSSIKMTLINLKISLKSNRSNRNIADF